MGGKRPAPVVTTRCPLHCPHPFSKWCETIRLEAPSLDSPESISLFRADACQFRLKRCADAHPMYSLDTFLHLGNPLLMIAEVILV
jgi:hypothetical protein